MNRRDSLADFLAQKILPLFHSGKQLYDPWWWPTGIGDKWKHWFGPVLDNHRVLGLVGRGQDDVMSSLREGPISAQQWMVNRESYEQFQGFWGDAVINGCIVIVVSDRPSQARYPTPGTTAFNNLLNELGCHGVHVTDFIKRRGPRDSILLPEGEVLADYADLLLEELLIVTGHRSEPVHIIPTRAKVLELLVTFGVASRLKESLGERDVTMAKMAPIFPWGTAVPRTAVLESWHQVLTRVG